MNKGYLLNLFFVTMTILAVIGVVYLSSKQKNVNNSYVSSTPSTTQTTTTPQTNQAYIKIIPSRMGIKVGDMFSTLITLGTENIEKNGAHIVLNFDPKILQVVDSDPAKVGVQVSITPDFYEAIGKNSVDNAKGTVEIIVSSKKSYIRPVEPVATVKFRAFTKGKSNLSFDVRKTSIFFTALKTERTTNFDTINIEVR